MEKAGAAFCRQRQSSSGLGEVDRNIATVEVVA